MSRPDLVLPVLKANPGEVDRIFLHPLEDIIDPKTVNRSDLDGLSLFNFGEVMPLSELVPRGGDYWPYDEEFHVCISMDSYGVGSVANNTILWARRFKTTLSRALEGIWSL